MCNHDTSLPGSTTPHAHLSSRNQRRLARRKGNSREARNRKTATPATARATSESPAQTVNRAIAEIASESDADTACQYCSDPECNGGEYCPERPMCGHEGCTGKPVELQEYEMAVKLHGADGNTPGKLLRTFVALDPEEAKRVKARLEKLESSGQIARYWMNPYRTWLMQLVDGWLNTTVPKEIEAARVATGGVATGAGAAGTVH